MWAQPPVASRRSPRPPWRRPVARSSSTTARHTPRAAPPRRPLRARRSGGRNFRSSASSAWGSWHALPGPSPIGSVWTARKHGGSLGGRATPLSRRAVRRPSLAETLTFPEPIANEAHARAGTCGAHRASARPPGAGRPGSQAARHLGEARRGGSWRSSPSAARADGGARPPSARAALRLSELPAPTAELRLELGELTESVGTQTELVRPRGSRCASACAEGCGRCARR